MKNLTLILTALIILISTPSHAASSIKVEVNGLVCDFCARALEKVFGKEESVKAIDVNLDTKIITVNFNEAQTLSDERITDLITAAGYNVEAIHRDE